MSVGFLMLAHASLDRGAQVARHWAESGCPVVIHLDGSVAAADHARFQRRLSTLANVRFARRHNCEWGTWSIVAATIAAAECMLEEFPEVRHVFLASGSCLPLRPLPELCAYLGARPDVDFIESVDSGEVAWATGGLDVERFDLRFPFSWKRQRRLFDGYVRLQRRLDIRRRRPEGLVPHLGSQWWCLTRATLAAILADPDRPRIDRYFRRVWIPDEAYFQTLARRHGRTIESRSLTLSKFDHQGRPHVFYDDHLQLLRRSDCFVARKIWPAADLLYRSFLSNDPKVTGNAEPNPAKINKLFSRTTEQRVRGRAGLRMQSRFLRPDWEEGRTAAPYSMLCGFAELFEGFEDWLGKSIGTRVHGHLFAPEGVGFAGGEPVYNGGLSASAALRDYDPEGFLTNLIWNTRGERQCFQFGPADRQRVARFAAYDRNAQIALIAGAWLVPLMGESADFRARRARAATLQRVEARHLALLRRNDVRARVRIWSLAEFFEAPADILQEVLDEMAPRSGRRLAEVPRIVDLAALPAFLQRLRNAGMDPHLAGDFPPVIAPTAHDGGAFASAAR